MLRFMPRRPGSDLVAVAGHVRWGGVELVEAARPNSLPLPHRLTLARRRSAITARSSSGRNRSDQSISTVFMPGACSSRPSRAATTHPFRQRVPVRRLTPTCRHASALATPRAISRPYCSRAYANGTAPGLFRRELLDSITTSTPCSVSRRSLGFRLSFSLMSGRLGLRLSGRSDAPSRSAQSEPEGRGCS